MKKVHLRVIAFLMLLPVLILFAGCEKKMNNNQDGIITMEEALYIGTQIFKEKYPEDFKSGEMKVVAEEREDVWYVRCYDPEPVDVLPDGTTTIAYGGGLGVELDKKTGEVIKFIVED